MICRYHYPELSAIQIHAPSQAVLSAPSSSRSRSQACAIEFEELHGRLILGARMPSWLAICNKRVVAGAEDELTTIIAHKRAANFVIARTSVQPPEREDALHADGESNHDPIRIHKTADSG